MSPSPDNTDPARPRPSIDAPIVVHGGKNEEAR